MTPQRPIRGGLLNWPACGPPAVHSRLSSVAAKKSTQWTLRHRFAVAADVFFVHCLFVRLSRFRFHRDFRA
jgi:hypothetical protein